MAKYKCEKCGKETSTLYANKEEHKMLCFECEDHAREEN